MRRYALRPLARRAGCCGSCFFPPCATGTNAEGRDVKGGTHKVGSAAALDVGARSITLRGLCRRKKTSQQPAAVFGCQGAWGRAQRPARHKQEPWGFAGGRALQGRSTQPAVKDRRPTTERSDLERGMGRLAPCPSDAWQPSPSRWQPGPLPWSFPRAALSLPSPPPSTEQRPAGAPAPAEQLQRSRTVAYATGEGRVSRLGRSPTRSAAEGIGLPESPRTVYCEAFSRREESRRGAVAGRAPPLAVACGLPLGRKPRAAQKRCHGPATARSASDPRSLLGRGYTQRGSRHPCSP